MEIPSPGSVLRAYLFIGLVVFFMRLPIKGFKIAVLSGLVWIALLHAYLKGLISGPTNNPFVAGLKVDDQTDARILVYDPLHKKLRHTDKDLVHRFIGESDMIFISIQDRSGKYGKPSLVAYRRVWGQNWITYSNRGVTILEAPFETITFDQCKKYIGEFKEAQPTFNLFKFTN